MPTLGIEPGSQRTARYHCASQTTLTILIHVVYTPVPKGSFSSEIVMVTPN